MRTSTLLHIAAVCVAVQLLPAYAQAPAKKTWRRRHPSWKKMEEGEQPAITIAPPDSGTKITEKRQQGKVTEVKVKKAARAPIT
ncbi:hypothetical protein ACFS07_04945 [Undibacterium arcticum]